MLENKNLTKQEIEKLQLSHDKNDDDMWNKTLDEIKAVRNGQYPPDWFQVAVIGIKEEGGTKSSITIQPVNINI